MIVAEIVFEIGDLRRPKILVEYFLVIKTRMRRKIMLDLLRCNGLVIEIPVHTPQYLPEQTIVVHAVPDGMQHISGLWIHIPAAFLVDIITRDDRPVIADTAADAIIISIACILTIHIFHKQRLAVIGIALVNIHIRQVFGGEIVAKPFVTAFMDNDKIPFHPYAGTGSIPAPIAISIMIAIGHGALMLHPRMLHIHSLYPSS